MTTPAIPTLNERIMRVSRTYHDRECHANALNRALGVYINDVNAALKAYRLASLKAPVDSDRKAMNERTVAAMYVEQAGRDVRDLMNESSRASMQLLHAVTDLRNAVDNPPVSPADDPDDGRVLGTPDDDDALVSSSRTLATPEGVDDAVRASVQDIVDNIVDDPAVMFLFDAFVDVLVSTTDAADVTLSRDHDGRVSTTVTRRARLTDGN